ncbi:hypothetical protein PT282_00155 [Bifidobacterium sp. ESL0763]|uniref:hypothetical protein n=1 Tax=Bifidobacterium sp. ESL0763 TaxID=2983227 RepID=UPI0023F98E6C|nr:hypothetical protein [Bifidobacterium sp. ESL0763]MDF7663098.1 hypothetical protein [Bifidobacterium sp. ESL0763]
MIDPTFVFFGVAVTARTGGTAAFVFWLLTIALFLLSVGLLVAYLAIRAPRRARVIFGKVCAVLAIITMVLLIYQVWWVFWSFQNATGGVSGYYRLEPASPRGCHVVVAQSPSARHDDLYLQRPFSPAIHYFHSTGDDRNLDVRWKGDRAYVTAAPTISNLNRQQPYQRPADITVVSPQCR